MRFLLLGLGVLSLSACGGSGGTGVLLNPENAVLGVNEDAITLQTNDLDATFDLDSDLDRDVFAGARRELDEEENTNQILLFSEGDNTFAALLLTREDTVAGDAFFDRTTDTASLPDGTATLTGTYLGAFVGPNLKIGGPTAGVLTLEVDFDEMTLNGSVAERSLVLSTPFGDLPFVLSDEFNVVFPEMTINSDGTFSGTGERDVPSEANPDNPARVTTDVIGVIDGAEIDGVEAVGSVSVEAVFQGTEGVSTIEKITREEGVFAVGHD